MLRLPSQIGIGPYTLHLDVLAARMRRRQRRVHQLGRWAIALFGLGFIVAIGFPFVRGTGVIVVPVHDVSMTLLLNGHPLTSDSVRVPPGSHLLRIEQTGAFPVEQTLKVTKQQTTTLTLPLLRPIPLVQRLPLPHSQSRWTQVSPDVSSGWRIAATQPAPEVASGVRPGWGTSAARPSRMLLHLDAEGLTPLAVLETHAVADEMVTSEGGRFWAMWEAQNTASRPGIVGVLSLTTPTSTQALSTTVALHGLWWSPGGAMLLVAIPREQGLDLALINPKHPQTEAIEPIITVSDAIQSVNWHPDGRAVVVTSASEEAIEQSQLPSRPTQTPQDAVPSESIRLSRSAVLLQLSSDDEAKPQAVRLHSPPAYLANIVALDWSADELWWVADTGLGLALEQVSLSNTTVRRVGELPPDLATFTVLPDMTIRIIRETEEKQLVVERWPEGTHLFTLPDPVAHGSSGGTWRDADLLLATSETELWYIHIQPEALQ